MLRFRKGDATCTPPMTLLVHVVNDVGAWGAGFSGAVSRRWPHVEGSYCAWAAGHFKNTTETVEKLALGKVLYTLVSKVPPVWIANLCAQRGISRVPRTTLLQYDALETCLGDAGVFATARGLKVQMPRIGCGLAGGTWTKVEPIVMAKLVDQGLDVTVYDLP